MAGLPPDSASAIAAIKLAHAFVPYWVPFAADSQTDLSCAYDKTAMSHRHGPGSARGPGRKHAAFRHRGWSTTPDIRIQRVHPLLERNVIALQQHPSVTG